MLKVQEVLIHEKKRYLLIDNGGYPVTSVAKYIKYLDNIGKAENTLKSYCYHLKLYFQFLEECGLEYQEVNLEEKNRNRFYASYASAYICHRVT